MNKKALFFSLGLAWGCSMLVAQSIDSLVIDTLAKTSVKIDQWTPGYDLAYEYLDAQASPFAIEQHQVSSFNQGLISDPTLLIQGKVAGAQIYNRGGDPNVQSLMRVRGISARSQRQPLFVIDGVPGAALESLDPNDVASITVLKDGAGQSLYGIRASNGVVLITTKTASADGGLAISYNGQAASSQAHSTIPVMSARDFVNAGGYDFGSNTNWLDEVQRSGFSQAHGLAVSGGKADTRYRISGNYRNVQGVLRKSGFTQANLRANVQTRLLNDKLKVMLSGAYTDRSSELGFQEAFRYAKQFNPTSPIFAVNAPLPFNAPQYGGFYELLGLWDAFNPKAIVELNDRNANNQVFSGTALLQYELTSGLNVNFRYAYQDQFSNERAYYSPQSLFRGYAISPLENTRGGADLYDLDQSLSVSELFVNYGIKLGKLKLKVTGGTSYSDGRADEFGFDLRGFNNPELLDNNRIDEFADWATEAIINDTLSSGWSTKHSAVFGRLQMSIADAFYLHAALRSEGSSRLGEKWDAFPSVGLAYDMSKNMDRFDLFKFRFSYGVTGAIPDEAGLSSRLTETIIGTDGTTTVNVLREANPNLAAERKTETNFGFDVRTNRLQAYVEWYSRKVTDWIVGDFGTFTFGTNNVANTIKSTGLELGLDAILQHNEQFTYQMGFRLATFKSVYDELESEIGLLQISSTCCNSGEPLIVGIEGERVGDILAAEFLAVDPQTGAPVFVDQNQDGVIRITDDVVNTPDSDLIVAGNGLPTMEIGWSHQLRYGQWEVHAFLRGAFGHSLYNQFRARQEVNGTLTDQYNFVNTELAEDGLRFGGNADIFIEKADFMKLDYFTIARNFPVKLGNGDARLRVSLTAQNILIASSYTGADPEPSLEHGFSLSNGQRDGNFRSPLRAGVDRRTQYLPANTYSLGVSLGF